MRKRYEQIMDRVSVTDEMSRRILGNIRDMNLVPAPPRKGLPSYVKTLAAAVCLVVILAGTALYPGGLLRQAPMEPKDPAVQVMPDIQECASLQSLSEAVGFEVIELSSLPFDVTDKTYTAFWKEVAQIDYSGEGQSALYRMWAGTEDRSGDYNLFENETEAVLDIGRATLKGNEGGYSFALWTDGTYSYSLKLSLEVPEDKILEMISVR